MDPYRTYTNEYPLISEQLPTLPEYLLATRILIAEVELGLVSVEIMQSQNKRGEQK